MSLNHYHSWCCCSVAAAIFIGFSLSTGTSKVAIFNPSFTHNNFKVNGKQEQYLSCPTRSPRPCEPGGSRYIPKPVRSPSSFVIGNLPNLSVQLPPSRKDG